MKRFIVLTLLLLFVGVTADAQSRLEHLTVKSEILGVEKNYSIYLPDGYDTSKERYPVLYLLHGAWGNHKSWNRDGGGEQPRITDEQIAAGKAVKMIVVMPDATGIGERRGGKNMGYFNVRNWAYEDFFFKEFIPHIDKTFRTIATKEGRAIAGLSMGGGQSWSIGLKHPEVFANIGIFSSGMFGGVLYKPFDLAVELPELLADPQAFNDNLDLFYISCGETDPRITHTKAAVEAMRENGAEIHFSAFPGGHEWQPWRKSLHELAQMLFK